ncbi:hypothetical protein K525DRAFT_212575 [Schizophyllum commune Loenen D]|nr:hypothetical protein K525DRAFT_212575 [Schizophyllum commune Loenen D]
MPRLESVDMDGRILPILKLLRAPRVKSITVRRCQLNDNDATASLLEFLDVAEFAPTDVHHLELLNFHHQPRSTMDDGRVGRLLLMLLTLRRLESLRSLSIGVGSGQCNPAMSFAPGASLFDRIREQGLLPNLTDLTVNYGCKDGHPYPLDIRQSVRKLVESRASPCIINGRNVVALQRVETDFDVSSGERFVVE